MVGAKAAVELRTINTAVRIQKRLVNIVGNIGGNIGEKIQKRLGKRLWNIGKETMKK